MASIVCPSCGIKVRAGRDRCPRCRQPLAALATAQPEPAAPSEAASRPESKAFVPAVVGIVILVAALAGFAFWQNGESTASFPAAAAPVTVARTAAAAPPAAAQSERPAVAPTSEQFIDPAQGGRLAYSGGDYEQALELYESAVVKRPQDAEAWSNLGQVLVRLNRAEQSVEKFEKAIELNPDRWTYHFNLARAQGLLGSWDKAVEEYRAAQRLYPDDYATAFNLGLSLRKAGDDAAAVDAFKRAIELDPQEPTFHFSLAGAYETLGQVPDAIAEYQRTLDLAGAAPEAPAIQARITRLKGEPARATAPAPAAEKEPARASGSGR